MSRKVLQIGYELERDRLTWDDRDIHCGYGMEVMLPDQFDCGTWRAVSFEYNDDGWYMPGALVCLRLACGQGSGTSKKAAM